MVPLTRCSLRLLLRNPSRSAFNHYRSCSATWFREHPQSQVLQSSFYTSSLRLHRQILPTPATKGCKHRSSLNEDRHSTDSAASVTSDGFWKSRHTWNRAAINTFRCLIGCTLGDFSALWILQAKYPELGINTIMGISSMCIPKNPL